ncbi:FadR/GntR family transcriptional regulator [Kribbella sp. NPDC050820]|uniref:FadR/GntR family transcriptional regulator n=1 Tax=Kribbella sp. NPDC050820 TaxID=3155408 RepID=UPI0033E37440
MSSSTGSSQGVSAAFEKIQVQTRSEKVAAELARYIEAADLRPGDQLPGETTLAAEFGVSRSVVREAIRDLAGKGVVQVSNGRRAIIRPVEIGPLQDFFDRATLMGSDDTVLELMEVRRGLENVSATLAATRRSSSDVARLKELARAMAANIDNEDRYVDLDVEFHVQITKAAGNVMLGLLVESVREAVRGAVQRGMRPRREHSEREHVQRLHEKVLRAIIDGDAEAARQAMNRHFDVAIATINADQASLDTDVDAQ